MHTLLRLKITRKTKLVETKDIERGADLCRRGFLAKAPREKIYFKHSSPLAFAAKV
jgi:hypothetical protein